MKVVYNDCWGEFGLSNKAMEIYFRRKGEVMPAGLFRSICRWDPILIEIVEELGEEAKARDAMKVVYNDCWGGFGLSNKAMEIYFRRKGEVTPVGLFRNICRWDPILIEIVEELGEEANAKYANLKIWNVPKGERFRIDEYDGLERVMLVSDYKWETAT